MTRALIKLTVIQRVALLANVVVHVGDADAVEQTDCDAHEELRDEEQYDGTHKGRHHVLGVVLSTH